MVSDAELYVFPESVRYESWDEFFAAFPSGNLSSASSASYTLGDNGRIHYITMSPWVHRHVRADIDGLGSRIYEGRRSVVHVEEESW